MQVDEVVSATGVKREAPPDAGDAAAAVEKKQIAANPAGDKDPLERAQGGSMPINKKYLRPVIVRPSTVGEGDAAGRDRGGDDRRAPKGKEAKGQNKNSRHKKNVENAREMKKNVNLCSFTKLGKQCPYGEACKYSHDVTVFLATRQPDIALDGVSCPFFSTYQWCPYGVSCRWGGDHMMKNITAESITAGADLGNVNSRPEGIPEFGNQAILDKDSQGKLRRKQAAFPYSLIVLNDLDCQHQLDEGGIIKESKGKFALQKGDKGNGGKGAKGGGKYGNKKGAGGHEDGVIRDFSKPNKWLEGKGYVVNNKWFWTADEAFAEFRLAMKRKPPRIVTKAQREADEAKARAKEAAAVDDEAAQVKNAAEAVLAVAEARRAYVEVRQHPREKKRIDFRNKTYMAPLTTVGNLPFRCVAKEFGCDITCGEMAMGMNLVQGQQSEWALLKRHPMEDIFGVQIAGSYPDTMTKAAEVINKYADVDFVDINCGCPIDLLCAQGAGQALGEAKHKLRKIVMGMDRVLDCPVTVKIRKGKDDNNLTAHKMVPEISSWGANAVTLHGRTRRQRYTKLADWEYVYRVSKVRRGILYSDDPTAAAAADAAAAALNADAGGAGDGDMDLDAVAATAADADFNYNGPVAQMLGNGDVYTYSEYHKHLESSSLATCMMARGALIKPWIFTEIKEKRVWDISSGERLDMLRKFVHYGLYHWGSDEQGVNTTRNFLLEALSFFYRYVPVGLLDLSPTEFPFINLRPDAYYGRDDMETLMASPDSNDWVKISEMLLGPVPTGFNFIPKHKSNAWSSDTAPLGQG